MSSSTDDVDFDTIKEKGSYRPGTVRYHEMPTDKRKRLFQERQSELNPCLKEAEISNACLGLNTQNYYKCQAEVENYKTCKQFWAAVRNFTKDNFLMKYDGFPPSSERPIWKKQLQTWIQTKKLTLPEELKQSK